MAGAKLFKVSFHECVMPGTDLCGADLTRWTVMNTDLRSVNFAQARLNQAYLRCCNLAGQRFTGCDLTMTLFNEAKLQGADFSGLALDRTSFMGAHLQQAKLVGIKGNYTALLGANLGQADLSGAVFEMADASDADLTGSNCSDSRWHMCMLQRAKAMQARFVNASLVYCDLSHADLSAADFSRADLSGANLHAILGGGTRWEGAQREGVRETDEALARAERWQPA